VSSILTEQAQAYGAYRKPKHKIEAALKTLNNLPQENTAPGPLHKALCILELHISSL
jgi:hypothetical protein